MDCTTKHYNALSIIYEKPEVVCLADGAQYLSFEYVSVLKQTHSVAKEAFSAPFTALSLSFCFSIKMRIYLLVMLPVTSHRLDSPTSDVTGE